LVYLKGEAKELVKATSAGTLFSDEEGMMMCTILFCYYILIIIVIIDYIIVLSFELVGTHYFMRIFT